jgi:TM2 domain-containing membrane protein YozV
MLDTQQQMLIEQRVQNDSKSTGVAYLLWFLLAGFGAHRFYLGHVGSGIVMALITFVGLFTLFPLIITAIWSLVDAFLIPGMIRQQKENIRIDMATRLMGSSAAR